MSNLVPEKRMDRIGRLITRWVRGDDAQSQRNTILGTVIPVIPPSSGAYIAERHRSHAASHAAMSIRIHESLNESVDLVIDDRLMYIDDAEDRELMKKIHASELRGRIKAVVAKLPEYEAETLQVLYDRLKGTQHLLRVLEKPFDDETVLREEVHFSILDQNRNLSLPRKVYFAPIREGVFDVNGLSELPVGSAEHEAVRATLDLINFDYWEVNAEKSEWRGINVVDVFDGKRPEWADPDNAVWLTKMTLAHPDRIDDIKQYLLDHKVNINEVDEGHLEEYLNTAAPALAEGVL
jgi:hypothetical protein